MKKKYETLKLSVDNDKIRIIFLKSGDVEYIDDINDFASSINKFNDEGWFVSTTFRDTNGYITYIMTREIEDLMY